MTTHSPGVLPGEPNPSTPRRGPKKPPKGDMKYAAMKKAVATPGTSPGEKDIYARIMEHRGVDMAKAKQIAAYRTSAGLTTAGIAGPNGMKPGGAKSPTPRKPVGMPLGVRPGSPATGTAPRIGPKTPGSGATNVGRKTKPVMPRGAR